MTAGHGAGHVLALFIEHREQFHHCIEPVRLLRPVAQVDAAHLQVFGDGQVRENAPALGHEGDAFLDDLVGGGGERLLAPVHPAGNHRRQTHDGLEHGGLAGPVGSHHRDDLALLDAHGDVVQRPDRAVLDGYADQLQQRGSSPLPAALTRGLHRR